MAFRMGSFLGGAVQGYGIGQQYLERHRQMEESEEERKDRASLRKIMRDWKMPEDEAIRIEKIPMPNEKPVGVDEAVALPTRVPAPMQRTDTMGMQTLPWTPGTPPPQAQTLPYDPSQQPPALQRLPMQGPPQAPTAMPPQAMPPGIEMGRRPPPGTRFQADRDYYGQSGRDMVGPEPQIEGSKPIAEPPPQQMPGQMQQEMPMARRLSMLERQSRALEDLQSRLSKGGHGREAFGVFMQRMQIEQPLIQDSFDRAMRAYSVTGDPRAFIAPFNRAAGDLQIRDIAKTGNGYLMRGVREDGKPFSVQMTPEQMREQITRWSDPNTYRAMQAKRAEELFKSNAKIREKLSEIAAQQAAKEQEPTTLSEGQSRYYPRTGQTVQGPPKREMWSAVRTKEGAFLYSTTNPSNRIRLSGPEGGTGAAADAEERPRPVRDLQSKSLALLQRVNRVDSQDFTTEQAETLAEQADMASRIVAANFDTDNWGTLNEGTVVAIVRAIQTGKAKPEYDASGQPASVEYKGRVYRLDADRGPSRNAPPRQAPAAPAAAPAQANGQPEGARRPTPKVGEVINGWRYRGGPTKDQSSWERVR